VKLIDFAALRVEDATDQGATTTAINGIGARLGSPAYMSPEQCRGQAPAKLSELYSFACVMFECLSGVHPFASRSALEFLNKHVTQSPPPLRCRPETPEGKALASLIQRCLSKEMSERPQSALEVKQELERIFSKGDNAIGNFAVSEAKPKAKARRNALLALLFVIPPAVLFAILLREKELNAHHAAEM
jgi:serine/threonine-protein kinase